MGALTSRNSNDRAQETTQSRMAQVDASNGLKEYQERLTTLHNSKKKLPKFVPVPDKSLGLITKIYDGDTLTILCEVGGRTTQLSVRIIGIDTPELHRGKAPNEGQTAKMIRDLIHDLFLGKFASVANCDTDKYGRLLATVFVHCDTATPDEMTSSLKRTVDLGEFLKDNKLAYTYGGGTKVEFSQDDLSSMRSTCEQLRRTLISESRDH